MEFNELLRDGVSIVAVLGLLAGALHLARTRGLLTGGPMLSRKLVVVERVGLTPNHSLHLVRTDRGTFLIGTHQHGFLLIDPVRAVAAGDAQVRQAEFGSAC